MRTKRASADKLVDKWVERLRPCPAGRQGLYRQGDEAHVPAHRTASLTAIPVTRVPKVKVGVVGEIYVKYSPLGNNDLQKFLESQDCEVNFPGLMGFVQYCALQHGRRSCSVRRQAGHQRWSSTSSSTIWTALSAPCSKPRQTPVSTLPAPLRSWWRSPRALSRLGAKMGEGWLLTAEMIELVQGGYGNIVCAQPFGCLPNHIVGKGMVNKIRALYPACQHHPHRLRPQRHQGQSGKPHQADAGCGERAAQQSGTGARQAPDRGGAGRRRAPAEP